MNFWARRKFKIELLILYSKDWARRFFDVNLLIMNYQSTLSTDEAFSESEASRGGTTAEGSIYVPESDEDDYSVVFPLDETIDIGSATGDERQKYLKSILVLVDAPETFVSALTKISFDSNGKCIIDKSIPINDVDTHFYFYYIRHCIRYL